MGIEKDRRNRQAPAFKSTGQSSFGGVNVSSLMNAVGAAVSGVASIAALSGVAAWRGLTTVLSATSSIVVSSTLVSSAHPPLVSMGATSVASHRNLVTTVDSIVDGVSFCIVTNLVTVASQQVVFVIIG